MMHVIRTSDVYHLFALLHSLNLHFCFRHYCFSNLSYTTAVFMLTSGHLGLEIKIQYYCTLSSTGKHLKDHHLQRMPVCDDRCELTDVTGHVAAHSPL